MIRGMRGWASVFTVLLAFGCNEVLGLDPGTMKRDGAGGGSFSGARGGKKSTGHEGGAPEGGNGDEGGAPEGGNGDEGGAPACSTTADCRDRGLASPPYLCLAGSCVDVSSEECDTLLGAEWLADHPEDQPIVFGALAENVDENSAEYWSLELAMKEFSEHGPIPIDGAPQRPVLLLCRVDSDDPFSQPTPRALDHLIDEVKVPGMVMIQSRPDVLTSIQYAIAEKPAQSFFIDTGSSTSELLALRDGGRLWHMQAGAGNLGLLYYPLTRTVEEHMNPGASSGSGAHLTRVVMIPPDEEDGFESVMARMVEGGVFTNDRLMVYYPDTYRLVDARHRPGAAARETAAFEPDIVFDFVGIYGYIDQTVRERGGVLPFYILPPSQSRNRALREAVAADPSLQTRVIGLDHAGPDETHKPLYDAYLERFADLAPAEVDGTASANVYEAMYFLMYAAVGGGTDNMKLGMTRLLGLLAASRSDIGPMSIDSVTELLGSVPSVSLHGALGPPSFDPTSGERYMPATVWCIDESLEFRMDALTLAHNAAEGDHFVGPFPCFDIGVSPMSR
jgi:hypothetical protein